jgi:hypothetical protein
MRDLNHIGIDREYLPIDLFNKLKEQINLLQGKKEQQHRLAGNIKEEWNIEEAIPLFESYILSLIYKHPNQINFLLSQKKKISWGYTSSVKIRKFMGKFSKKI